MDFASLPKAEIHVHIEGCFEPEAIEKLAQAAGVPLPRSLDKLYDTSSLANFLEFLDWKCSLVRTKDQLAEAAYAVSRRMTASGVRYADVIVNPTHWAHWQSNLPGMIDAFDNGFAAAEQDGFAPTKLCVSLLRKQTEDQAIEVVETLLTLRHPRVVALSVDGNEAAAGRTGPRFAEAYRRAAAGGLRRTAHAGESSGPEGVWDAIDLLGAERIDHGVRAIEDADLVKTLVDRNIALGITPTSNLTLRMYDGYDSHPFEALRRAGVPVSVNTDDPCPLNLSLPQEYSNMAEANGWDKEVVRSLAATSIKASFAEPSLKADILADLARW